MVSDTVASSAVASSTVASDAAAGGRCLGRRRCLERCRIGRRCLDVAVASDAVRPGLIAVVGADPLMRTVPDHRNVRTEADPHPARSRLGAPPSLAAMARATPFRHIAIVQSRVISACTDQVARSRSRPRHHPRHRDATRHQDPLGHRHRAGHHASDRYLPEARPPLVAVIQHLHHRFEGAGFLAQDANVGRRDWNCTVHP